MIVIFSGLPNCPRIIQFLNAMGSTYKSIIFLFQMQCFPIFSLILALGNPVIDYLSLDIEGTELEVSTYYKEAAEFFR